MNKTKKIGGEFEINPDVFSGLNLNSVYDTRKKSFASGRHALLSILKYLTRIGRSSIYLPDFLCDSIIQTVLAENYKISFYHVNNNLTVNINIKDLEQNSIFFLINHFGLVDHNELIDNIKSSRPDINVIYDCVQAFYDFENTNSDFAFNSFRKFFAIPEGAYVKSNFLDYNETSNLHESNFHLFKIIGSLLKYNQINDLGYLSFLKNGEENLNKTNEITKASSLFGYLHMKTDFDDIKNKRKINSETIFNLCHKNKLDLLTDLKPGKVPSHIPIYIENRDEIRTKLLKQNIFLPQIWPVPDVLNFQKNIVLYNSVLALIVDQRYSPDDMKFQINSIIKLLK